MSEVGSEDQPVISNSYKITRRGFLSNLVTGLVGFTIGRHSIQKSIPHPDTALVHQPEVIPAIIPDVATVSDATTVESPIETTPEIAISHINMADFVSSKEDMGVVIYSLDFEKLAAENPDIVRRREDEEFHGYVFENPNDATFVLDFTEIAKSEKLVHLGKTIIKNALMQNIDYQNPGEVPMTEKTSAGLVLIGNFEIIVDSKQTGHKAKISGIPRENPADHPVRVIYARSREGKEAQDKIKVQGIAIEGVNFGIQTIDYTPAPAAIAADNVHLEIRDSEIDCDYRKSFVMQHVSNQFDKIPDTNDEIRKAKQEIVMGFLSYKYMKKEISRGIILNNSTIVPLSLVIDNLDLQNCLWDAVTSTGPCNAIIRSSTIKQDEIALQRMGGGAAIGLTHNSSGTLSVENSTISFTKGIWTIDDDFGAGSNTGACSVRETRVRSLKWALSSRNVAESYSDVILEIPPNNISRVMVDRNVATYPFTSAGIVILPVNEKARLDNIKFVFLDEGEVLPGEVVLMTLFVSDRFQNKDEFVKHFTESCEIVDTFTIVSKGVKYKIDKNKILKVLPDLWTSKKETIGAVFFFWNHDLQALGVCYGRSEDLNSMTVSGNVIWIYPG